MHPRTELAAALHALLGVVASLLAVERPIAGVVLTFVVIASSVSDRLGGPALLRRLTPRRATQTVLGPGPQAGLVVHARLDAPRRGLAARLPFEPLVPVALVGVLATAGVRGLGVDDRLLAYAQLVPTALLLIALAAFCDVAFGTPADEQDATPAAMAAGLAAGATIVLHGAGESGLRAHLRRHRPPKGIRWVAVRPGDDPKAVAERLRTD